MKRALSLTVAIGLVAAVTAPASAEKPAAPTPTRSVTLITGDKVVVPDGTSRPSVVPGKGREHMTFRSHTVAGHLNVVPADALSLVSAGRLDPRLFDVTALLDAGYDDRRGDLPLIVAGAAPGMRTTRELPAAGARAVTAEKSALAGSWRALAVGASKVWLDGKRKATLDRSAAQIGAPQAWQAGFTGAGVVVAVLDTGVDQTHPDLAGRVIAERNFSGAADGVDHIGHGTHVGSTIVGGGAKYRGIANGAKLLDGKVLDDDGYGQDSWIIAGMEWAVEQGAKIVNLSLGADDTPEIDPLEAAVDRLSAERGTLFVISAGNAGPTAGTVGSPGSADAALTVGSVERDDSLSFFSSRGPRVGDGAIKPDVTAPGSEIVAAQAKYGTIGTPVEPGYVALSGTSMAAPHVAGAAALLAQKYPQWTGAQLKAALTASARPTAAETVFTQGSGRIDVPKALAQNVTSSPTSISLGVQQWPHGDDQPVSKDIVYRNSGSAPVTLDLALAVVGPDGKPAPNDLLSLSQNKVEVPAGATATVKVIADTRHGSADGVYSGAVVATSGQTTVRTPLGVDREVESYQLKVTYLGLDGKPTDEVSPALFTGEGGIFPSVTHGVIDRRLPKGRYVFDATFYFEGDPNIYSVAYPRFDFAKDTELVVDARTAKPVRITPPDPSAHPDLGTSTYTVTLGNNPVSVGIGGGSPNTLRTAHLGPELPANADLDAEHLVVDLGRVLWAGVVPGEIHPHRLHPRCQTR